MKAVVDVDERGEGTDGGVVSGDGVGDGVVTVYSLYTYLGTREGGGLR